MHLNHSISLGRYNLMVKEARMYSVDCFPLPLPTPWFRAVKVDYPLQSKGFTPRLLSQSCNGVFLIGGYIGRTDVFYLWNPSTKQHKTLPTTLSQVPDNLRRYNRVFGLGYDSNKNDYKVIRIIHHYVQANNGSHVESVVHVYSLQTNLCREKIQDVPDFITDDLCNDLSETGVFVRGAIHWWFPTPARDFYRLVAFDVSTEEYKQVPMPDYIKINESCKLTFGAMGDCLCLYQHCVQDCRVDVLMMKAYGVKESWTMLHTVDLYENTAYPYLKPLWVTQNEMHIVLKKSNKDKYGNTPPLLHIKKERISMEFQFLGTPASCMERIEPWIESLVSLEQNAIVEKE